MRNLNPKIREISIFLSLDKRKLLFKSFLGFGIAQKLTEFFDDEPKFWMPLFNEIL